MSIRATFEIIFSDSQSQPIDLEAQVLREVHERVIVDKSSSFRQGATVSVSLVATFANTPEVLDHERRFTNMTGAPSRDVLIRRLKDL